MRGNHVGELRPTCIHLPELRRHGRSQVGANLLRDGQDSKPVWHGSRQALIDGNLHSDSSLDHRFPALLPLLYGPPFFLGNTLVLVGLGIVIRFILVRFSILVVVRIGRQGLLDLFIAHLEQLTQGLKDAKGFCTGLVTLLRACTLPREPLGFRDQRVV